MLHVIPVHEISNLENISKVTYVIFMFKEKISFFVANILGYFIS